jgi:hypothetical protein
LRYISNPAEAPFTARNFTWRHRICSPMPMSRPKFTVQALCAPDVRRPCPRLAAVAGQGDRAADPQQLSAQPDAMTSQNKEKS